MSSIRCVAIILPALAFSLISLSGCIRPHKVPITQGNIVNRKDFNLLELGMTKDQIEYLIGRPILIEPFDNSRWEYVYLGFIGNRAPVKRKMILEFDGNRLVKIDGNILQNQTSEEQGDNDEEDEESEAEDQ